MYKSSEATAASEPHTRDEGMYPKRMTALPTDCTSTERANGVCVGPDGPKEVRPVGHLRAVKN